MEIQKQEVILKIEDLTKSFGKTEVLKGIGMEVHKNEIISVLGPSGCGKSTLLNIIAGIFNHAVSRWRARDHERTGDL